MLSVFRRLVKSKVGAFVAFVILALVAFAFAAGDVTGLAPSGAVAGGSVASVDGTSIGETELRKRATDELNAARQQTPTVDAAQFAAAGGVEAVLDRIINGLALQSFGKDQGIAVSPALVGSQLRSFPGLQGPTGKFEQKIYEQMLAQRGLTDKQVQSDIARETMAQFLIVPTIGASQVPAQLAAPYAALLLERRTGEIGLVPSSAVPAGPPPTAAELQTWYKRNVARYTVPERRVVRYAIVTPEQVKAQAVPTDADIAKAYNGDRGRFAATEKRTIAQVTVLDQAAANALAAKVKSGTPIADAARAAGLEARTVEKIEKAGYTSQTSAAVANAVFGAAQGAVVGPVRGSLGFVVARVEAIEAVAGRSLAEARAELIPELTRQKTAEALAKIHDALDDAIGDNANFSELASDQKLTPTVTPPLLVNGLNPDAANVRPDPALAPILGAAFAAEEGDTPTLVQTGADGSFAVVALERIVRTAPRPLTQVQEQVARDFTADRARRAARTIATAVLARANKGTPLAAALAQSDIRTPVQSLNSARAQLSADPRGAPPPLALLFSMAQGTAKMLEAPNDQGWLIVKLDTIVPGDASKQPGVISATRGDLGRVVGREYAQQFTNAVKAAVGVKRDAKALAKAKADFTGGSNQP